MDEYIPQLTLTPDLNAQPQPEVKKEDDLITKAQAAPEAGPDLSALSEQEQQAVLTFSKQIDLENAQQILEYGASASGWTQMMSLRVSVPLSMPAGVIQMLPCVSRMERLPPDMVVRPLS